MSLENTYAFKFWMEVEKDIPSENFMYHPRKAGGRVFLYKDYLVSEFQDSIVRHLMDHYSHDTIPSRENYIGIFSLISIYYKEERYFERDVENSTKAINDAVFNFFKHLQEKNNEKVDIDDSLIISQYHIKYPSVIPYISCSYYFIFSEYEKTVMEIMYEEFCRRYYK